MKGIGMNKEEILLSMREICDSISSIANFYLPDAIASNSNKADAELLEAIDLAADIKYYASLIDNMSI